VLAQCPGTERPKLSQSTSPGRKSGDVVDMPTLETGLEPDKPTAEEIRATGSAAPVLVLPVAMSNGQ